MRLEDAFRRARTDVRFEPSSAPPQKRFAKHGLGGGFSWNLMYLCEKYFEARLVYRATKGEYLKIDSMTAVGGVVEPVSGEGTKGKIQFNKILGYSMIDSIPQAEVQFFHVILPMTGETTKSLGSRPQITCNASDQGK